MLQIERRVLLTHLMGDRFIGCAANGYSYTLLDKVVWPADRCALLLKVCKPRAQKEQDVKVFMCPLSIYLLELKHEN